VLLCVIVLFVRKGGEGVLEPVTWRDPLLVVSARRCLSPCPNPSPALRASFGFMPISSVYLSIYVENYQNKLPPISALQSQWALRIGFRSSSTQESHRPQISCRSSTRSSSRTAGSTQPAASSQRHTLLVRLSLPQPPPSGMTRACRGHGTVQLGC
jgi:hypothetical protein